MWPPAKENIPWKTHRLFWQPNTYGRCQFQFLVFQQLLSGLQLIHRPFHVDFGRSILFQLTHQIALSNQYKAAISRVRSIAAHIATHTCSLTKKRNGARISSVFGSAMVGIKFNLTLRCAFFEPQLSASFDFLIELFGDSLLLLSGAEHVTADTQMPRLANNWRATNGLEYVLQTTVKQLRTEFIYYLCHTLDKQCVNIDPKSMEYGYFDTCKRSTCLSPEKLCFFFISRFRSEISSATMNITWKLTKWLQRSPITALHPGSCQCAWMTAFGMNAQ